MDRDITRKYTNGEVTVVWKPKTCIHSTICWKAATGLPEVFNPMKKPWITLEGSDTEHIVSQVKKCPSGALSFYYNNENSEKVEVTAQTEVEVTPNGPLLVYGNISIRDAAGNETKRHKVTAFCRCGHSQNKPYCDGSHVRQGFNG